MSGTVFSQKMSVIVCIALSGLPSGCARYQARPVSAERNGAVFESRRLDDAGLKAFLERGPGRSFLSWPLSVWDFERLAAAAFYFHPDLDVARAEWAVADAGRVSAGERPNPSVAFSPAYNSTTPPPWILGLDFDIPIETAGKRGYRISQAGYLAEAARLKVASVGWQVRARLRGSMLDLYEASETEALLRTQETAQTEAVRLLEQQLAAGNVSGFELTQARIALGAVKLSAQQARRQAAEARARVAGAVGLPVRALDGVEISFVGLDEFPDSPTSDEVRRRAVLGRADLLGALAEYAASQSALQLEIARQYPDVHIGPGYQLDQTDNKWALGLTVDLPLLNQNQGPIAEAEARRAESAARFNALQAGIVGDIDSALAGYRAALRQVASARTLTEELERQRRSVEAKFEAGESDRLHLVAAQLELSAGDKARLDATVGAQRALGALEDAVQSPLNLSDSVLEAGRSNPRTAREKSSP